MIVNLLGSYIAFAGSVIASMIFLWALHDLTAPVIVITAIFGAITACIPTGLIVIVRHRARFVDWYQNRAPRRLQRFPGLRTIVPELSEMDAEIVREPRLMAKVAAYELAIILLDSGTLWVLLMAIGVHVHAGRAFVAFVIALTAGTVSITPGGLATFEAACVAMLTTLGVGTEAALTGTLLLRGFTFWLPMVPGFWLVRKELAAEAKATSE
jgi:uncharacterized protein (TIRG00374 family)